MTPQIEIVSSQVSVVLVGSFNPMIFQPHWLATHGVIGKEEAELAVTDKKVAIVHAEVMSMNYAWIRLDVTLDRFALIVNEEPFIRARDFCESCFNLLSHTPVRVMGLNKTVVFKAPSESAWHAFGDYLAPKEPWGFLLGDSTAERTGGLRLLLMERNRRPDEFSGYIRVKIEARDPKKLETAIEVNDHYELAAQDEFAPASAAVEVLMAQWDRAVNRADEIISKLTAKCYAL